MRCKTNPRAILEIIYTLLTAASVEIESTAAACLNSNPGRPSGYSLMPAKLSLALSLDECDRLIQTDHLRTTYDGI